MFKIQTIKRERGEVEIVLVLQTPKIKEKFANLKQRLYFKFKLCRAAVKLLRASSQTVSLRREGNQNLLFLSWEEKPQKGRATSFWQNLIKNIITKIKSIVRIKKGKRKIIEGITSIIIIALISGLSFYLILPTKANEDNLCPVDSDVVLAMDVSQSMKAGESPSKCEWSEIKQVPGEGYYTWFLNVKYNVTYEWCMEIRDSFDQSSPSYQYKAPTYTPAKNQKISDAKTTANTFLNNLGQKEQSALLSFNNTSNLDKSLSADHEATKTAVNGLTISGSTNLGEAISAAIGQLQNSREDFRTNKTIIIFSDGRANRPDGSGPDNNINPADENYSRVKAQEAANWGFKIYTLGFGQDVNTDLLEDIANLSGGRYYFEPTENQLIAIYNEISQALCGSISGCKYLDSDNDGDITEESSKLSGWEIVLAGDASSTQLTDESGCYSFSGLLAGNYTVSEGENVGNQPYLLTFPQENSYNVILAKGENREKIDFANYLPGCGNQILDANFGEVCEISNLQSCSTAEGYNGNQSCNNTCTGWGQCVSQESCGDGIKNGNEECDGINGLLEHYNCSQFCTLEYQPYCGDGLKNQPTEECDSATSRACLTTGGYNGQQSCLDCLWSACQTQESCGDGIKNGQELCDDGNIQAGDGCSATCQTESQEPAEPVCGNGILEQGEECDDGNSQAGDGCSASCQTESQEPAEPVCGNSILEQGEQCDDGNVLDGDGCSTACQTESQEPPEPACGNGILEQGEECDDGNIQDGDGCSAACQTEEQSGQISQEPTPAVSGGGSVGHYGLYIHTQSTTILEQSTDSFSVVIIWFTNLPATSRVLYDNVPHSSFSDPPNYGYQWSTPTSDSDPKVTYHEVEIGDLKPGATYYFRPISHGSPVVFGNELEYTVPMTTLEKTEESPESATTTEIVKETQPSAEAQKAIQKPQARTPSQPPSGQILGEKTEKELAAVPAILPEREAKTNQPTAFGLWYALSIGFMIGLILVYYGYKRIKAKKI